MLHMPSLDLQPLQKSCIHTMLLWIGTGTLSQTEHLCKRALHVACVCRARHMACESGVVPTPERGALTDRAPECYQQGLHQWWPDSGLNITKMACSSHVTAKFADTLVLLSPYRECTGGHSGSTHTVIVRWQSDATSPLMG